VLRAYVMSELSAWSSHPSPAPSSGSSPRPSSSSRAACAAVGELPCPFCTTTLPFEANLARHVSLFHSGQVPIVASAARTGPEGDRPAPLAIGRDAHVPRQGIGRVPHGAGASVADAHASAVLLSAHHGGVVGDDACSHHSDDHHTGGETSDDAVVVRGSVSARPLRLSRVRHVFQSTTAALVYRFFLGMGDITRAQPLIPLHRQGRPTAFVTEELKAIRLFALSTGGKGMSEKARVDYNNSVARAEAMTPSTAEKVVEEVEHELANSSGASSSSICSNGSIKTDAAGGSWTSAQPRSKRRSLRKRLRKAIASAKCKLRSSLP